jgi:hypothetical protein
LAAFALIEGIREGGWWRAGAAAVILTLCAAYVVSQLRRPRYTPNGAAAPEAQRQNNEEAK